MWILAVLALLCGYFFGKVHATVLRSREKPVMPPVADDGWKEANAVFRAIEQSKALTDVPLSKPTLVAMIPEVAVEDYPVMWIH